MKSFCEPSQLPWRLKSIDEHRPRSCRKDGVARSYAAWIQKRRWRVVVIGIKCTIRRRSLHSFFPPYFFLRSHPIRISEEYPIGSRLVLIRAKTKTKETATTKGIFVWKNEWNSAVSDFTIMEFRPTPPATARSSNVIKSKLIPVWFIKKRVSAFNENIRF